jgi:hypothetical protein
MKDSMKILGDIVGPASEEDEWEVHRDEIREDTEQADHSELVEGAEVSAKDPKSLSSDQVR